MHETPWDFWRFSDTSWNSLFNCYTGFRVLDTFLGVEFGCASCNAGLLSGLISTYELQCGFRTTTSSQ